jgi:hypothetical protein
VIRATKLDRVAGPLSGIRVVELGQVIAGPFCAQMLGDLGAEVIKVEPPGKGDVLRQWGHADVTGDSLWWSVAGRNKRSITVDLRTPGGQQLVRDLVAHADILVENFRPGTLEGWSLGWEDLSAVRPELIMVRISGFGQTGPYARRAGYASSARRWAACARSPATRTGHRSGWASRSATRSPACSARWAPSPRWRRAIAPAAARSSTRASSQIKQFQERFIAGWAGYPVVGTPEQVVEELGRLNEAGMDGMIMGFVDYNEEMKYFGEKVLPLMKEAGLRH